MKPLPVIAPCIFCTYKRWRYFQHHVVQMEPFCCYSFLDWGVPCWGLSWLGLSHVMSFIFGFLDWGSLKLVGASNSLDPSRIEPYKVKKGAAWSAHLSDTLGVPVHPLQMVRGGSANSYHTLGEVNHPLTWGNILFIGEIIDQSGQFYSLTTTQSSKYDAFNGFFN